VLTNKTCRTKINNACINFIGVDDILEGRPEVPKLDSKQHSEVNILLTHSLDAVNSSYPDSFDLLLSGHTHGGEVLGGFKIMQATGYAADLNRQKVGWKNLTDRALSYVHPGLARHWIQFGAMKPGATLMTLTSNRYK
jgi:predicted MPP superfamily phosphohydrolase